MITQLTLNFEMSDKHPGYLYENHSLLKLPKTRAMKGIDERVHADDLVKIRVPHVMPDIGMSKGKEQLKNGEPLFINASSCMPNYKADLKKQPYIEMRAERNVETRPMYKGERVVVNFSCKSLYTYSFNSDEQEG